jgi:tetratricopeptide (TPR) repeat protein
VADSPRIEELKRRVQSDPASIAFAALAEEYRRAGRFDEAIDTCNTGLVRHPSYLSAHVTLGRALIDVGRLEEAREELQQVLRLAPENLAAIRGLAEIHDRLGAEDHAHSPEAPPEPSSAPAMTVAEVQAASGFKPPEADLSASAFESHSPGVAEAAALPIVDTGAPASNAWEQNSPAPIPLTASPSLSDQEPFQPSAPAFVTPEIDRDHPPAEAAALAGLEEFLAAIQRARTHRAADR